LPIFLQGLENPILAPLVSGPHKGVDVVPAGAQIVRKIRGATVEARVVVGHVAGVVLWRVGESCHEQGVRGVGGVYGGAQSPVVLPLQGRGHG
jgi:hypothetical protein